MFGLTWRFRIKDPSVVKQFEELAANVTSLLDPALRAATGTILPYGGTTAPTGCLICDGTRIGRVQYAVLFAVIGVKFGAGDGTTTFNLPNAIGVFPACGSAGALGGVIVTGL